MTSDEILDLLRAQARPEVVPDMARYGINPEGTLGISMPYLRGLAREIGKNHDLALELWTSGIHEARILASLVDLPARVTPEQMDNWVADFDSWDVCDQVCQNLFRKVPFAREKALEWQGRSEAFTRRAAFTLFAQLAVHDHKATDEDFLDLLPLIEEASSDDRNYVKKAVNWALRQIGKRNTFLNAQATDLADRLRRSSWRSARWIGSDAYRELTSAPTLARVQAKEARSVRVRKADRLQHLV